FLEKNRGINKVCLLDFYLYLQELDEIRTMMRQNFNNHHTIAALVSEYEAMSQKGTVGFLEEKVFLQLIDYYQDQLQIDRALEVVDHALAQYNFSADFYIRKAQLLIESRQEEKAIDSLEQAQIYAPSEIGIFLLRVEILCSLGKHEEALILLESIKPNATGEDLNEIYLYEARICEYRQQFEEMYYVLEKILISDPRNKEALERMWLCVELSQKYKESIKLHTRLIDEHPYSHLAWFNLGHAYQATNQLKFAREAFEYAFIVNEKFQDAYKDCALVCYDLGDYKKALTCYEEVLEHFEPDSNILMNIGRCYQAMGDVSIARAFYIKSVALHPQNDDAHYFLAECYAIDEQWKAAKESYRTAMRIENRKEEYYSGLAKACFELGEEEEANNLLMRAIEVAPEQIYTWIQYALFLMETGRFDHALDVLDDTCLNLTDDDPQLHYCRIACLFLKGRRQEALYRLGEVLSEYFDDYQLLFKFAPELEDDIDILNLIERYRLY
ncbi:MAG: tetratricopeptide repeat protein, partial [Bacteroidota bacterium]